MSTAIAENLKGIWKW